MHKDTINAIAETTGAAVITKGVYVQPGKRVSVGTHAGMSQHVDHVIAYAFGVLQNASSFVLLAWAPVQVMACTSAPRFCHDNVQSACKGHHHCMICTCQNRWLVNSVAV
jgi:hypothetical protein